MTTDKRTLELAMKGLEIERTQLANEEVQLRALLSTVHSNGGSAGGTANPPGTAVRTDNRPKVMTPAARRKISLAMKRRWAASKRAAVVHSRR